MDATSLMLSIGEEVIKERLTHPIVGPKVLLLLTLVGFYR